MKRVYLSSIITVLIILTLMVIGCSKSGSDVSSRSQEQIYIGTEGLKMKFVNNMPPSKLYDTSSLNILLELENKGTYDLSGNKCRLYLSGFNDKIIRGLDKEKACSNSLEGKGILNPEGSYNTQQFTTDLIEIPDYLDKLPQKVLVSACYKYQTTASPIVCVDPNLFEIGPIEKACSVRDVSMGGGQGAPISVTGVEVEMAGKDRVAFNIKISNTGGGTPFYHGASLSRDCPYNINPKDYDVVVYNVEMSGGTKLNCAPEIEGDNRVRLTNGKGTIFCTFKISGEFAYTTPLRVTLDYNYLSSISKSIDIIKTPQ